jgi:hypothetical protein
MTRVELLRAVIRQAKQNGFVFRTWYEARIGLPWVSLPAAVEIIAEQRRYYALLFSHEFAEAFWKSGVKMTYLVPPTSFITQTRNGRIITVERKPYTRRTNRPDNWRYHLREMAAHAEPLRYIRRFVVVAEDLVATAASSAADDFYSEDVPTRQR